MHVSLVQSYHHDCTWLKEKARCAQGSIVTLPGCLTCSILFSTGEAFFFVVGGFPTIGQSARFFVVLPE